MKIDSDILKKVLDLAVSLQQIPSPTFHEEKLVLFLKDVFQEMGLQDVAIDDIGNLYGRLPGGGGEDSIVLSAHADTVFPMNTELHLEITEDKISGPSIGDNSLGVAGLIGLLWLLRENDISLPGDLWLVANVGEEGLGDLAGMRAVVDRFKDTPKAYIILEGMALGQIFHRGLGVERYRIRIKTKGGHSWSQYGEPSAVHHLARLVARLDAMPLPKEPRTTLNVGVFHGGVSVNTIAPEAYLELDLRSEGQKTLDGLVQRVKDLVVEMQTPGVDIDMERIGKRPAGGISENHPLVCLAEKILRQEKIQSRLTIASTDANIPLSLGLPAVCIGLTTGANAHTLQEYIDVAPLKVGLTQLYRLVLALFDIAV